MQYSTSNVFQILRAADNENLRLIVLKFKKMGYESYGEVTYFPPYLNGKKEGEYVQIMIKPDEDTDS